MPIKYHVPEEGTVSLNIMHDLKNAMDYINKNPVVWYALFKMFIATSALAVVGLLAISYAKDVLMIGARNFGYLVIAAGFGMFTGMFLLGRLSHYFKKTTILIVSFILSGATLLTMAGISDIKIALALIFVLGLCNIFINSSIQTILQSVVPLGMRGRVFGFQNMLINSAFTLPLILFGIIADMWGIRSTMGVLGVIMILSAFTGFIPIGRVRQS